MEGSCRTCLRANFDTEYNFRSCRLGIIGIDADSVENSCRAYLTLDKVEATSASGHRANEFRRNGEVFYV